MGAAIAVALCASLCGPEVFLLDLAGLWEYIEVGRQGSILGNPLKVGVSLATAPHVVITLLGKFKGESGAHRDRSKVVDGAAVGGAPTGGLRTGPAFEDRLERVVSSRSFSRSFENHRFLTSQKLPSDRKGGAEEFAFSLPTS